MSLTAVTDNTIDSSNWTTLFDPNYLQYMYEENGGKLSVTFKPPIRCKIDTSSGPADTIAVPVRAISKKRGSKKRGMQKQ